MAIIAGPGLDEIVREVTTWYLDTREWLIQMLESPYPYGSTPLTSSEQVDRFMSMTPEDWEELTTKLTDRHRGKPKAEELVRKDLEEFVAKMNRMAFSGRTV